MDPQTRQPQSQPAGEQDKNLAQRVSDKVAQTADDLRSKSPGEIADDARARTTEALETAKQRTAEAGAVASDKASDVMSAAGSQMSTLAQNVRERAPVEGRAGDIATSAADALERSGRYLQEADPAAVRTDLERVIRDHPIEAMLVGLGLGYLLARSTRR